jgi:hypothetical protein
VAQRSPQLPALERVIQPVCPRPAA